MKIMVFRDGGALGFWIIFCVSIKVLLPSYHNSFMNVICMEDTAFYALIEEVVLRLQEQHAAVPDKWVDRTEAMRLLNITSKTTLQKFRDEGRIRFSQPQKKIILYDRESINDFLEKHAQETF